MALDAAVVPIGIAGARAGKTGRPAPAPRRGRVFPVLGVVAGTAVIGWQAARYGSWIEDDAAITFAYARSITDGLGPVVAGGTQPVEGFSNPTWLALLCVGRLVGLFDRGTLFGVPDYVVFPKALALLCCAGILVACHRIAGEVVRRPWLVTLAVGVVLSCIPSFVIWCFSGLENSLYAMVVVWLAAVLFRAARPGSPGVARTAGALAAAAALTRPDGLIYLAAYPLALLACGTFRVRPVLWSLGAFAVPFGGYLCWRVVEFGRLVPNTAVAKGQTMPELTDFTRAGELVHNLGALAVLAVAVITAVVLCRSPRWRSGLVVLLLCLGLATFAYELLNEDWMGHYRFATPVWTLTALVGVLVTAELFRSARPVGRVLLVAALVATVVPAGAVLRADAEAFARYPVFPMCYVADRTGRVFNRIAEILDTPGATVFEPDLGGASLTTSLRIVDMAGLTEPRVADLTNAHDMAGLRDYVFDEVRPTYIYSRGPWGYDTTGPWGQGNSITSDPRLTRDYVEIYRYPDPGPPAGNWVRKDAVHDPAALQAAREYTATAVPSVEDNSLVWPLRHCGDVLRPGQTEIGQT